MLLIIGSSSPLQANNMRSLSFEAHSTLASIFRWRLVIEVSWQGYAASVHTSSHHACGTDAFREYHLSNSASLCCLQQDYRLAIARLSLDQANFAVSRWPTV